MVIVTHEMNFAKDVSNRMIFMDKGVIVEETTPELLFTSTNQRTREFLENIMTWRSGRMFCIKIICPAWKKYLTSNAWINIIKNGKKM